jgi:hypothetical protein
MRYGGGGWHGMAENPFYRAMTLRQPSKKALFLPVNGLKLPGINSLAVDGPLTGLKWAPANSIQNRWS